MAKLDEETEVVIYAKIGVSYGLKEADHIEQHDQYEGQFNTGGRCRVRRTTAADGTPSQYTLTIKRDFDNDHLSYCEESTTDIDEVFYAAFIRAGANRRIRKTRYTFNSENVELRLNDSTVITLPHIRYEVDVFKIPQSDGDGWTGDDSTWCKIDIEIDHLLERIQSLNLSVKDIALRIKISHLPFAPTHGIIEGSETDEQRQFLDQLWQTEFVKAI